MPAWKKIREKRESGWLKRRLALQRQRHPAIALALIRVLFKDVLKSADIGRSIAVNGA